MANKKFAKVRKAVKKQIRTGATEKASAHEKRSNLDPPRDDDITVPKNS